MASICGIVSQHGKIDEDTTKPLGKMIKLTRHRGPDNVHVRTLPDYRGAVGAAEINLTPQTTHCTSINDDPPYILFDGELYNDRPDGQSDLDLFKEYWEKYERNCFSRLDGSFSCAVVEKDEEVILARDYVGARPLFYGEADNRFYFCSEMKGLADHVPFDIHELAPGQIYSTKKGMKEFEPFEAETPQLGHLDEAAKTLRNLLIEAVKERMEGVEALSLSGGLDSSIIAAIAKEFNPDLNLFTVAVQSAPGPDLENAELMADFLGMKHHIYEITDDDIDNFISDAVWYLESFDEDCISGILSNYYASKIVKDYSNAVLVGEGADELFGGIEWY
ncbi:MAG: asparagine synthase-related protein [Deltaproteobacteria bacterium]|nr:asparagine synthase-related protein [Deltaproteobacteria bacterium]